MANSGTQKSGISRRIVKASRAGRVGGQHSSGALRMIGNGQLKPAARAVKRFRGGGGAQRKQLRRMCERASRPVARAASEQLV